MVSIQHVLIQKFPLSIVDPFIVTSPATVQYNCIAWAFGDDKRFYWPDADNLMFWPNGIPREETFEAFIELYKLIGYEVCGNGSFETEYEKIAIYEGKNGKPTHAARQIDEKYWTSKLGPFVDVSHSIDAMQGGEYGYVKFFMKRKK
jgi:hypothetical protein